MAWWQESSTFGLLCGLVLGAAATADNMPAGGSLGEVNVPLFHAEAGRGTLKLSYAHLMSSLGDLPPIFILVGGPGASGLELLEDDRFQPTLDALLARRDVVLFDQRVVPTNAPDLTCDQYRDVDPSRPFTAEDHVEIAKQLARECRTELADKDLIDRLAAYTTRENADDIAVIAHHLGFEKIALLGMSYGTHLALTTLRRHEQLIERAILFGVEGPDHTVKMPTSLDALLVELDGLADDAGWPLELKPSAAVAKALAVFDEPKHFSIDLDGRLQTVTISRYDVESAVVASVGDSTFLRKLQIYLRAVFQGRFHDIYREVAHHRIWVEEPQFAATECASGASQERLSAIASSLERSILQAPQSWPFPDVCASWGISTMDDAFHEPVHTDVPVLLVSGGLDGQTPAANGHSVLQTLSKGTHVVVQGVGHSWSEVFGASAFLRDTVQSFLDGNAVSSEKIVAPFAFETGE